MRVLRTGMSGTGKSTLVAALPRRGLAAVDADDDGWSESGSDGRWGWRVDAVRGLLATHGADPLCFAGCDEAQGSLPFDRTVLLTVPEAVLVERLRSRTRNPSGRSAAERAQVLADLRTVEPRLRASADLVLDATAPIEETADTVISGIPGAA